MSWDSEENQRWQTLADRLNIGTLRDYPEAHANWTTLHDIVEQAGYADPTKANNPQGNEGSIPDDAALEAIAVWAEGGRVGTPPGDSFPSLSGRTTWDPNDVRPGVTYGITEEVEIPTRTAIYRGRHANLDGSGNTINVLDSSGIHGIGFGPADFRGAWLDPVGYTAQSIKDFLENDFKDSAGQQYPISWDWNIPGDPRPLRAESMRTVLNNAINNPETETRTTTRFDFPQGSFTSTGMDWVEGFDAGDYKAWLLRANLDHPGNTHVLRTLREDILDWLDNEYTGPEPDANFVAALRKERFEPFSQNKYWDDRNGQVSNDMTSFFGAWKDTPAGRAKEQRIFNLNDVLSMQAAGFDDFDIYMYMKDNQDMLKDDDGKWIAGSVAAYNQVRDRLIDRGNTYLALRAPDDEGHTDFYQYKYQVFMHPYIREIGDEINWRGENLETRSERVTYQTGWPQDFVNDSDFDRMKSYLWDEHGVRDYHQLNTQSAANQVLGPLSRPGFEATRLGVDGDYWEQWGSAGPYFELSEDGETAGRGLSDIQQLVAAAGLYAEDTEQYAEQLEHIESRFLHEMYTGTEEVPAAWQTATDDWGLDLKRKVWNESQAEWESLDFDGLNWNEDGELTNHAWYETLTKGAIDWAFYDDSPVYQKARENLGLAGNYSDYVNVAEIRAANAWVHGQTAAIVPEDGESNVPAIVDWVPYNPRFSAETAEPWTPMDLEITNYIPADRKTITTDKTQISVPNINIISNELRLPSNLENWPHSTPTTAGPTSGETNE